MLLSKRSWISAHLIVLFIVFLSYAAFLFPAFSLTYFSRTPVTHYQYLTEGFLSGHLSLSIAPSKELLNIPDPYDPHQNQDLRLHDASLYQGKYYLYFGALPVLTFFLPIKLLTGWYAPEPLGVLFFCVIGFLANFYLLISIKQKYFPAISQAQVLFAGLVLGFADNAPYLLSRPEFYEAAIASAFCSVSIALCFLFKLLHNHFKIRDAFLFSLFLSLAVAGRPHFALLCFFLIPAVGVYLIKHAPKQQLRNLLIAIILPAISIGLVLALYNYLRFHSFMEFGEHYQLAGTDVRQSGIFDTRHILNNLHYGLFYYFLQPYRFRATFPYIYVHYMHYIPSKQYFFDPVVGILATSPFVVFFLALPKLLLKAHKNTHEQNALIWFMSFVFFVPVIMAAFLLSLAGAHQRYETDFTPYLILLSIISLWLLQEKYPQLFLTKFAIPFFIVTGIASILIGMNLGFYTVYYQCSNWTEIFYYFDNVRVCYHSAY